MEDLLPELCDRYEADVRILEPMLGNFGGKERFSGRIVTIKAFEDNSLVREQVAQPGEGRVLVVDGDLGRHEQLVAVDGAALVFSVQCAINLKALSEASLISLNCSILDANHSCNRATLGKSPSTTCAYSCR